MSASEPNAIGELTIREPDDWHLHVRDDDMMALIAHYSARQFARAIIMPNLVPPVTTVAAAEFTVTASWKLCRMVIGLHL